MVQPKKHYKRTDKFMRGLEKIMLVVSTIDPNLKDESKQESSECNSFESPSKRIRLASGDDEPGPCDSADEASIASVSMDIVAGPSSKDDNNVVMENGVNGDHHAAATARVDDGGEENMDIDTECTSSQARLSVTEPSPDDSAETGVESSAAAEAMNNTSDEGHDTMETVARDNQPETGVESSSP